MPGGCRPSTPKVAAAVTHTGGRGKGHRRLVFQRGSRGGVLGVVAYLGFDVLMLWSAFRPSTPIRFRSMRSS